MTLTPDMLKRQSETAYRQWAPQWREHARAASKYAMLPLSDLENTGVGKPVLCAANGASLAREMETIVRLRDRVSVMACDKSLGHLMRHGVRPDYLLVADANVSYELYLEPWKDQLEETILFSSVCANPKWADYGNWKERYFFGLTDVLGSEKEFMELSGCPNAIVAGTNVSNAMVVLLTQCDNEVRRNFFGYDKLLLVGYDYCWLAGGDYYAYDREGSGKANYMRQIYARTAENDLCYTSTNLAVSAQWLEGYVKNFRLPVVQCSRSTVLGLKNMGILSEQMDYTHRRDDRDLVIRLSREHAKLRGRMGEIQESLRRISRDHHQAFAASF